MEKPFIHLGDVEFLPFYPLVIDGYEAPKGFPNCCALHKEIFRASNEFLNKFPNCCNEHRILARNPTFKKESFEGHILNIVDRVAYTDHHIEVKINEPGWYRDITNYIEYIISSFGNYGVGAHIYTSGLKNFIDARKDQISFDKVQKLLDYIDSFYKSEKVIAKPVDLNILYDTYKKWLNVFPFQYSLFGNMREKFSHRLPFLAEEPVYNRYTGLAKSRVFTKKELVEFLVEKTKQILQKVDSVKLVEEGYIKDTSKFRIELANERHRIKQLSLVKEFSKGETRYLTIIKKWLKNEKEYFVQIAQLIDNGTGAKKVELGLSLRQIALLHIYQGKSIGRGKEADKIARKYNYQSGERLYKLYIKFARTSDRTGVEGKEIEPLIRDITTILPYLNEQQKRQAETEIETISNKIQD